MKILLVEDEPQISHYIARGLERARYAVDVADDGQLGLYQAAINKYDVILCDYILPHRDGIRLAAELRDRSVGTPMIMLTVCDDLGTRLKAFDAGVDDFMCKPFAFAELLARIRAVVRRGPEVTDNVLTCGDLSLDVRGHVALRDGLSIRLTRREFMLLEYLMRHKESVVSRADLIEHVWESEADPATNSIEVHVRYLRKKLEIPFRDRPKLIHTVHGVGYKLSTTPARTFAR